MEEDAPGSKPDPVETRQTTVDYDEFINTLNELSVNPDTEELNDVFTDAGFVASILDTRYYGETHAPGIPHVNSSVIQLESEQGAEDALEWIHDDDMKPCPTSCAVQIGGLEVDGIPDAQGVHRSASAADIIRLGAEGDMPFDSYRIVFTDGPFVYTVDLHGPPGSVSEEQAKSIADALYERVSALDS